MAQKKSTKVLSVVHPICCGIDVHKEVIVCCILKQRDNGTVEKVIKEFRTFTDDLFRFKDWLLEFDCSVVAMESTGIYWRPLHNVLEGSVDVVLVNARHMKNVPGRKTDVCDSQWIAELLMHGLLKGSFIPEKHIRELRDLTRLKRRHINTLADYKRRVQKLFESANIKIDVVASDLFGVTGRNLIDLLLSGDTIDLEAVKRCTRGKLKKKANELYRSIIGFFTDHHRGILASLMELITFFEKQIAELQQQLKEKTKEHQELINRMVEFPGIAENSAIEVLSESSNDLKEFANAPALCSWAGVCPGNNQSAGKRKSGKSSVKGHPLKTILVEIAWAAVKKKDSYYRDKFHRLKYRRGAKKAIVAIAHKILKALYYVIKDGQHYKEPGVEILEQKREKRLHRITRELEQLGMKAVPA